MNIVRRVINWGNEFFAVNWRWIPFQPVLFLFSFLGALLVIGLDLDHPTFPNSLTFWLWITLSLICPPMAFIAFRMIEHHPGRPRYIGLWVRFGSDIGQFASLTAFLTVVSQNIDLVAAEIYAAEMLAAIWWFLILLIVRDSWKLVLTERVAVALENRKDDENGS